MQKGKQSFVTKFSPGILGQRQNGHQELNPKSESTSGAACWFASFLFSLQWRNEVQCWELQIVCTTVGECVRTIDSELFLPHLVNGWEREIESSKCHSWRMDGTNAHVLFFEEIFQINARVTVTSNVPSICLCQIWVTALFTTIQNKSVVLSLNLLYFPCSW